MATRRWKRMARVATYFAMTLGAFLFWQSMDKVDVWIVLHQDEKVLCPDSSRSPRRWVNKRLEREMEITRLREELLAQAKQKDSLM